ncbi:MAG: VCBS repeat-containing protein [Bacteroidaceae bacterium]|nr:VCBS repeat-containing protein [Bacteroidaceae bacterium]
MKAKSILFVVALSLQCIQLQSQSSDIPFPADSTGIDAPDTTYADIPGAASDTIRTNGPDSPFDVGDDSGEGGNDRQDPNNPNPDPDDPPSPFDPDIPVGDFFSNPIDIGSKSDAFSYSSILNTQDYSNQYVGRNENDIFYKFTLTVSMSVTITHDGSNVFDTYMSLLDSSGTLIESNNDYSGDGHCFDTRQAFIRRQLAAGTYYVVSEGYSTNGIIKTNITGNVEAGYGYPSIPSTYSTDPGNAVGGMGTRFSVSPLGGAVCSIPIEVPVGVGGLQPSISITYNSQSGNGMAGYGTGLSGLSCITRGPRDIYHDTTAQGLKYLADDALYLDGVRLILSSGTAGQDGAVYNPESDPFTRVIAHGTCTSTSNSTWYEVQTPDGMNYRYGYTTDSRLSYTVGNSQRIHSWYLCRAEQPTGNYMTYSYTTSNSCVYPYQISYGGNSSQNTSHFNLVEFTYESRSDVIPIRFDGQQGSMGKRLKTITGKTGGTTFRTYTLTYNTTGDGTSLKYSRLVSVTEKNAQNETLPSTQLGWSYLPSVSYNSNSLALQNMSTMFATIDDPTVASGDLNGDGIDDMIAYGQSDDSDDKKLYLYKYLSQAAANGNTNYYDTIYQTVTPSYTTASGYSDYYLYALAQSSIGGTSTVDFDGDGSNELMIGHRYNKLSTGTFPDTLEHYVEFIFIRGNSYANATATMLRNNCTPLYSAADIDNDGRTDIVVLETVRDSYGCGRLHILSSSVDPSEYSILDVFGDPLSYSLDYDLYLRSTPRRIFLSDMNGNGLIDMLILYANGYDVLWNCGGSIADSNPLYVNGYTDNAYHHHGTELENYNMVTSGDFNGDGLLDILTNGSGNSSWYFNLSNGDGSFERMEACTLDLYDQSFTGGDDDRFHVDVFDFDGDGRSDIVVTKAVFERKWSIDGYYGEFKKTHTYWMRSTGTGLTQVYHATSNKVSDADSNRYTTGDFDGDGLAELVNYGYDCVNGSNSNSSPVWRIYKNSSLTAQSGRVTSVTGDFGATTTITYSTLSNPAVYSKGGTDAYPAPRYTIPLNVVRQTVENNGAAGSQTTLYSYEGLRTHLQGRGLLGFSKVTADNTTMGVTTESGVTQWDVVRYIPTATYTKTSVGSLNAQSTTTFTVVDKQNRKYFAYPYQTVATDLDGNTVTTTRTYNTTYGYMIREQSSYGNGMIRRTVYAGYSQSGGAYRPETVTASQTHADDGSLFSRKTKYLYNSATGLVTQRKDNQGTSLELTTNYTYDVWGNVLSEQVSATGITTLTTYHKYDSTHRFPLRTYTSPSSSVLRRTYDTWGHVLTEQDSVNTSIQNTVTHTYDGWGNLTLTGIPGCGEIRYIRGWSHDPAQRFFVLEQGSHRPWVKTWYDNRGREVRTESVGPNNVSLTSTTSYNSKGLVSGQTSTEGSLSLSTTYTYDSRGRVLTETAPGNAVTTYSYAGPQSGSIVTSRVTVTHNGRSVTTAYDAWGDVVSVTDPSSQNITYSYTSNGQPESTSVGSLTYTFSYDAVGNRTSLSDPDAGTTTYTYDALGREISRNDGRGIAFSTTYDYLGRVTARTAGNEQITYTYGTTGTGAMRLVQETKGSMTKSYAYDTYGRTTTISHMGNNTTYSYTTDGLLSSVTHPGNKTDTYTYDSYGNVSGINAVSGAMMWSRTGYTGASSTSSLALQNGSYPFVRTTSLDSNGMLNAMSLTRNSATLRGETYTFSPVTGNLTSRTVGNTTETFTYDLLDRLKKVQTGNQTTLDMTYGSNGNITSKTGIGSYEYSSSSKPHAVVAVENASGIIPEHTQSVSYNAWGKVSEITSVIGSDTYKYTITYGPDLERCYTYYKKNGVTQYYTYYGVGYENCYHQEPGTTAYTLRTYYVDTPDGLSGIVRYDSRTSTYTPYAVETDHLGSITALYNSSGTKVMGASFDAWGKRTQTTSTLEFRRGFTGHEHIDGFDLINMNGRVYDPLIGRFLSPDMYVQLPGFSQSFNRYSYCLNNPLKYTDPYGESWLIVGAVAFLLLTEEGYNVQKALSPVALHVDVHLGTHQLGLGFDVSVGLPTSSPISYRNHYGQTYFWKTYGSNSGWEYREGGEWGFQGLPYGIPYYINYSGTKFSGINSQTTNSVSLSMLPFRRTTYENDTELFVKLPGVPKYDNDDRYRTAAVSIKRGPFTLQTNLHTGSTSEDEERIIIEKGIRHFNGGDIDKQHHGILSVGFGPFRIGWDSEKIRHTFQNRMAHDHLWKYNYGKVYPWVLDNGQDDSFFFYIGSGTGNTMW